MPATHSVERLPVTRDADGSEISVAVHRLTGGPGPTLTLLGPQHGDEWWTIRLLQEVVGDLAACELAGTVVVVPVCNPPALRDRTRITQSDADEPDMNRAWGGSNTWIANLLCTVLDEHVVSRSDVLMDLHLGPAGTTFGAVCYGNDYPDRAVSERSRELALAFGYPVVGEMAVCGQFPGPRSLAGYAGTTHAIPTVLVEIGGAGHGAVAERQWLDQCRAGIRNVARAMGILGADGTGSEAQPAVATPAERPRTLLYRSARRVNPSYGGLMTPVREDHRLGEFVAAGTVLGLVHCPQTFELLETLTSPEDGYLFYYATARMVRAGDWAFGIVRADDSEWLSHA